MEAGQAQQKAGPLEWRREAGVRNVGRRAGWAAWDGMVRMSGCWNPTPSLGSEDRGRGPAGVEHRLPESMSVNDDGPTQPTERLPVCTSHLPWKEHKRNQERKGTAGREAANTTGSPASIFNGTS